MNTKKPRRAEAHVRLQFQMIHLVAVLSFGMMGCPVDSIPPEVTLTTPDDGAVHVNPSTSIAVTFTEPVDPRTVTPASFGAVGVTGSIRVSGETATLTPASLLSTDTTYIVTVSSAVTDLAGNALVAPKVWTFRTIDTVRPAVASASPSAGAQNVPANARVKVVFSEDVAPASITSTTVQVSRVGGVAVAGSFAVAGSEVSFTPASNLDLGASYSVTLTTGVTDKAGNGLAAAYSWTFRTVANGPPVARSGADRDASLAEVITLSGSTSSDPEGGPLSYQWTQTAGPSVTLSGATTATPSFSAPAQVCTLKFSLTVRDSLSLASAPDEVVVRVWVDRTRLLFVALTGNDANAGTSPAAPVRTIQAGLAKAAALGTGGAVYVAAGTFAESLTLTGAARVYGGFNPASWDRSTASFQTTVVGGPTAVTVSSANGAKLDGLTIQSASAVGTGGSSIGVLIRGSQSVELAFCSIRAGAGTGGRQGAVGTRGADAFDGVAGGAGSCNGERSPGAGGLGGAGANRGGNGGLGGYENLAGNRVAGQLGAPGAGPGGAGGNGGDVSEESGTSGLPGAWGVTGATGAGGAACGTVDPGLGYLPAKGANGLAGSAGRGGGGGGGSAGQWGPFVDDGAGNGGGGGGGGAYGGTGGEGGYGGGGSFGVVLSGSTGVIIRDGTIQTATGGVGGTGGMGGPGGIGGFGGIGSSFCRSEIGDSGWGGRGGNGGFGGQGGGGGGGPSIGILEDAASASARTALTITPGAGGAAGLPGGATGMASQYFKR